MAHPGGPPSCPNSAAPRVLTADPRPEPNCPMAENEPSPDRPKPRWPLILGSLVGGFLLLAVGLGLGWYLFYRPIVNVAVQLPAPPPPPAPPGPDAAQVKALEDQIDKQKAANKQIEDQIAMLKDRLRPTSAPSRIRWARPRRPRRRRRPARCRSARRKTISRCRGAFEAPRSCAKRMIAQHNM